MKNMLIIIFLLTSCVPVTPPAIPATTHHDVVYESDSTCASTYDWVDLTAQQRAGIVSNCTPGKSLMHITTLPNVRVVFLGLVNNDCNITPIDEYRARLQSLLISTTATVYCVLPTRLVRGQSCQAWADVMLEECTNTINPHDYGVLPRAKDGLHWNPIDHSENNFTRAISERI